MKEPSNSLRSDSPLLDAFEGKAACSLGKLPDIPFEFNVSDKLMPAGK
jgi:hypothetical protein